MGQVVATVTEFTGRFYAKDAQGNIFELASGDSIEAGMSVFGDSANNANDTMAFTTSQGRSFVLSSGQEQLFDTTMDGSEFEELDSSLEEGSVRNWMLASDEKIPVEEEVEEEETLFEEETAAGDEKKQGSDAGGEFAARDGNMADVNSGLRDARFQTKSSTFEIKSRFQREDEGEIEAIRSEQADSLMPQRPSSQTSNIPIAFPEVKPIEVPQIVPEIKEPVTEPLIAELFINNITVNEATGTATVTVTLSTQSTNNITVNYATQDDGATGSDYTGINGTLTFTAGETSKTIEVPITNDDIYEGSETLKVVLSNPTGGAIISDGEGIITITDDGTGTGGTNNDQPTMIIADTTTEEGSSAVFNITLSTETKEPYKVTFNTTTNGSTEAEDITTPIIVKDSNGNEIAENADGSYTVPAGETTLSVEVPTVNDDIYEGGETFELNGKTEFMDSDTSATGTIKDDGTAMDGDDTGSDVDNDIPTLSINSVDVNEGEKAEFTVSISNASTEDITFNLSTTADSATITDDYTDTYEISTDGGNNWTTATSATIAAGETSILVRVPTIEDEILESNEIFTLNAQVTSGTTTNASAEGTGTIIDNDSASLSINDITVNEATGTVTLMVTLSKASSGAVTVDYSTVNGTATSGDYTTTNGMLTFAAGETSKTIEVPITNDDIYEKSEVLSVNLTNPTGGATIAKDQGTITIKDDGMGTVEGDNVLDNDQPTMTIADTVTEEGSNAVFNVTLSNEAKEPYKVTFNTTTNGSAEADDITTPIIVKDSNGTIIEKNPDGSYTVPSGETNLTVEVPTVDDNVYEGDETFELNGKTEFMDSNTLGTGTIKDDGTATDGNDADSDVDDDTPIVSIVATDDNAVEGTTNNTLVFAATQTNVSDFDTTVDIKLNLDQTEVADITSISYTDANGDVVTLNDATAIGNFVTNGSSVKIEAGQTSSPQITITVANDNEYEVSESLNIVISNPANAVLGTTSASATIYDEDSTDPNETDPDNIDKQGDKPASATIGNPDAIAVDEDDLSGGSSPDATALTKTGSLDVTVGTESFDTVFNYSDGDNSGLTSKGATVYYYLDDMGHNLTASTANNEVGVAEDNTVFTATLTNPTNANAGYSFTLKGSIDHPTANGENTQAVDLAVRLVENGTSVDTDSFSVTITDDIPSPTGVSDELHIGPQVTNLVFTIDVSGSMAWAFDGSKDGSQDRLNAAKDSAKALIAEYEKLGEVNVMVTTFGGSTMSTLGSSVWMDANEARSEISGMSASGGTQYNSAMDHTAQTYMNSTIPQSNATVVYFISDGEPNNGYGPHQATLWDDFINRDEITSVDAVGVSNALGLMNLQIVAGINPAGEANYDNTESTTAVNANHLGLDIDGDAYVFDNADAMETKFIENATVASIGNVINDTINDKLYIVGGADDAYVQSIEIGNITYTYNGTSISNGSNTIGSGSVMEVETTLQRDDSTPIGSKIKFDFATGEYTYTINSTLGGVQYNETFNVVVVDNDGDTIEKTLSFDINTSPIDNSPLLDLDANDSTTADDSDDYNTAYTLGKQGISIGDVDVAISDNDDTHIENATITLTNAQTGDVLFAKELPSGITASAYDSNTGVITLSGSATLAEYESAIEAITFYSSGSDTTDRTVEVVVNDGENNSNTATTTISVANNALHVTATAPSVEEGTSAIFKVEFDESRNTDSKIYLTTTGDATSGSDYNTQMQYFDTDDLTWKDVLSDGGGNYIEIPQDKTRVDVKVKTLDDGEGDDGESLVLKASIDGDTSDLANDSASDMTIITEYPSLVVSAPSVVVEGNEAIFEVGLSNTKDSTTTVSLAISGEVDTNDYNTTLQYSTDEGASWQVVSGNVDIPANATQVPSILVKIITTDDGSGDDNESLTLTATTNDNGISSFGNSASDFTTLIEPLSLSVDEEKDETATGTTTVTTAVDANYDYIFNGNGANGTVTDNGDGTLTYTPNTNFSGSDSFSYIKVNKVTGEQIASVANVEVVAKADTPTIEIGASEAVIESLIDNSAWKEGSYNGQSINSGTIDVSAAVPTDLSDTSLDRSQFIVQQFDSEDGQNLDLNYLSTTTAGSPTLSVYWGYIDATGTLKVGDEITTSPITVITNVDGNLYNAVVFANTGGNNSTLTVDDVQLEQSSSGVKIYDVNITNDVTDTDGSEELQDVSLVVKDSSNNAIDSANYFNQGTYDTNTNTWTFTQLQLVSLQITVPEATVTSGFTLEATTTAQETSNADTASATTSIDIIDTNDAPLIGDNTLIMSNEADFVGTITETIETYFSTDGNNTFSWNEAKSNLPKIYADGQLVDITFDDATNTVKGTIDNGTTNIFSVKIEMSGVEGETHTTTNVVYTQYTELLGVERKIEGKIVLPGGGNNDSIVLGFNDADDNASGVDAVVVAHNLIEDTQAEIDSPEAEHTVNTNNFYIGVDSNNMNAGQQLIFDFITAGVALDSTNQSLGESHSNAVSAMDIKLFNFGSEKSGDELFITIHTSSGKEEIRLTQDSDYTSELEYTIRHSGGETIEKIEFLAGNESSFKLGIKGVSAVEYDTNFDMQLGYDITDSDGDSDGGNVVISLSGSNSGDNTITFEATKSAIDGGAGEDTLILNGSDIDFSTLDTKIQNIEKIDMTTGDSALTNLTLQDVIDMTDSNNTLVIEGDSADSVTFTTNDNWVKENSGDGYTEYTNSDNSNVTLKINEEIQQPM
jgi:Mg-chelatase subunit ChlD